MTDQPKDLYKLIVIVSFLIIRTQQYSIQRARYLDDKILTQSGVHEESFANGRNEQQQPEELQKSDIAQMNDHIEKVKDFMPFDTIISLLGRYYRRLKHYCHWPIEPRCMDQVWRR